MSKKPSPKIVASTVAGAAVIVGVWLASLAGVTVPTEVAGAATVIISAVSGYLIPDRGRHARE